MRKIFYVLATLIFTSMAISSCLKESENNISNIYYAGVSNPDSFVYTVPKDSVWKKDIVEALNKLKVTNEPFVVTDTATGSSQFYTIQRCDYKAAYAFDKMLKTVTLSGIKQAIYKEHADSLVKLGYNEGAEQLPIHQFTLNTSLYNLLNGTEIFYYRTDIK